MKLEKRIGGKTERFCEICHRVPAQDSRFDLRGELNCQADGTLVCTACLAQGKYQPKPKLQYTGESYKVFPTRPEVRTAKGMRDRVDVARLMELAKGL